MNKYLKQKTISLISLIYFAIISCPLILFANENNSDYASSLTGNWNGKRTKLYENGVDIRLSYRLDSLYNLSGGLKKGPKTLGNLDLKFLIDGEKLYNLSGSNMLIHFIGGHGGQPNAENVGSMLGVDNIEVASNSTKLYEAWISQSFFDDKFSILAGLHDLNTEFYVTESSGLFIQPTYGLGAEFAVTGVNGPSSFPTTSLAIRTKLQPNNQFYFQTAVFDGVPGNPDKPKGTHIHLKKKDGILFIAETGVDLDLGKYTIGFWRYSKKFNDHIAAASESYIGKTSQGGYITAEKMLYGIEDQPNIVAFIRAGKANASVSSIEYSWSSGLVFNRFIFDREDNSFGIGVSQANLSKKYRKSESLSELKTPAKETSFELTMSDKLAPWCTLQPDIQYIMHPATSMDLDKSYVKNSFLIGVKIILDF